MSELKFTAEHFAAFEAASREFLGRTQELLAPYFAADPLERRQARLSPGYAVRFEDAIQQASLVHAVGLGRRVIRGRPTNEVSIQLFVPQRPPRSLEQIAGGLRAWTKLPENYHGVPTSVIQRSVAQPLQVRATALGLYGYLEDVAPASPIAPGASVGHVSVWGGTIGCLCQPPTDMERRASGKYILSAYHVLGDMGLGNSGDVDVCQPGRGFGGTTAVAIHRPIPRTELPTSGSNVVMLCDAAIAEIKNEYSVVSGILDIGALAGTDVHKEKMEVMKRGATTGHSFGNVDLEHIDILVDFKHAAVVINSQFSIKSTSIFAKSGDSGAVVVSVSEQKAVGLLIAKADDICYATPIATVESKLGIQIVI